MKRWGWGAAAALALLADPAAAQFSYQPVGELVSGSGTGRIGDLFIYIPGMRFPMESGPAYANSQVYGHGGFHGPGGGQCDSANYSYPWWDNYCETRSWDMPLCPSGNGHQGQDIRPATCDKSVHWSVAADAGTITNIGSYSVYLTRSDGTRFRYLHLDMSRLAVSNGQSLSRGDRIGLVSNDFGGTPTTIHLHFDIRQNVAGHGNVYVPTYTSLVDSYERLIGVSTGTGGAGGAGGAAGTGGVPATGGAAGTGGVPATGGVPGTGGVPATGGATGVGGGAGFGAMGSGGTGNAGVGGGPPPGTGGTPTRPPTCSTLGCDGCTTCYDRCLCETRDAIMCDRACKDPNAPPPVSGNPNPAEQPESPWGGSDPGSSGGCSVGGPSPAPWGAALALLFAVGARRRRWT